MTYRMNKQKEDVQKMIQDVFDEDIFDSPIEINNSMDWIRYKDFLLLIIEVFQWKSVFMQIKNEYGDIIPIFLFLFFYYIKRVASMVR